MVGPTARLNEMIGKLKEQGHRLTPQRMAVLRILAGTQSHPSAEQIYDSVKADFPMTSLATVYKTVTLLKGMGEVLEIGFPGDCHRFDGNRPYPHPHMVCVKCRSIVDPELAALNELTREVGQQTGYRIVDYRLDFFGVCPQCQRQD